MDGLENCLAGPNETRFTDNIESISTLLFVMKKVRRLKKKYVETIVT